MKNDNISKDKTACILKEQKKWIRHIFIDYLLGTLFLIAIAVICLLAPINDSENTDVIQIRNYFMIPTLAGICLFFVIITIGHLIVLCKLSRVKDSTTERVTIKCKKVRFLNAQRSRHSSWITCVIFVDENNRKYVYQLTGGISDRKTKALRKKLTGNNVFLRCYVNTNIVSTSASIDNIR